MSKFRREDLMLTPGARACLLLAVLNASTPPLQSEQLNRSVEMCRYYSLANIRRVPECSKGKTGTRLSPSSNSFIPQLHFQLNMKTFQPLGNYKFHFRLLIKETLARKNAHVFFGPIPQKIMNTKYFQYTSSQNYF